MGDSVRMDVVQGPDELLSDLPDLGLFEVVVILDDIEELSLA